MSWWILDLYREGMVVELVSQLFWVVFSITLHELAHGWVAIRQGDDTPRRLGRMTANPLVHMGPMSLIMLVLVGIAWGVMPVDPSKFRWRRKGRIVVAAAGPAMNLALAFVALTALAIWTAFGPADANIYRNLAWFLFIGGYLNIVLAAFNLLPIPPLDGSSILSALSLRIYQFYQNPQAAMIGLFVVLVIFFVTPLGDLFFVGGMTGALVYVEVAQAVLGGPPAGEVLFGGI